MMRYWLLSILAVGLLSAVGFFAFRAPAQAGTVCCCTYPNPFGGSNAYCLSQNLPDNSCVDHPGLDGYPFYETYGYCCSGQNYKNECKSAALIDHGQSSPPPQQTQTCCADNTPGKQPSVSYFVIATGKTCLDYGPASFPGTTGWHTANPSICDNAAQGIAPKAAATLCDEAKYNVGSILPPCTKCGTCGVDDFLQLFINLYSFGLHDILAPLAALFFVVGSVILLTATGYSERIEMGKTILTQTIAGVIVVLISWVVIDTSIFLLTGNKDRTVLGKKWYGGTELTYPCDADTDSLQSNCSGTDVKTLQTNLSRLGYTLDTKGVYNTATTAAVKNFQLDANGIMITNGASPTLCSLDLWNQIFHTNWETDGTADLANFCDTGNNNGANCLVPDVVQQVTLLPTNGISDTRTTKLIHLFANSFAGEFQTKCNYTKLSL